jgi:hypothetical protein
MWLPQGSSRSETLPGNCGTGSLGRNSFLASDDASGINGIDLRVDAGFAQI